MPLDPLLNLVTWIRGLGNEVAVWWDFPTTVVSDSLVVIFKTTTERTAAQWDTIITAYFTTDILPDDVTFDYFPHENKTYTDFDVLNGTPYYYAAVLATRTPPADGATYGTWDEYSTDLITSGTPALSIKSIIYDARKSVFEAIENVFFPATNQKKGKDIFLVYGFSPFTGQYPTIAVGRANIVTEQKYLAKMIGEVSRDETKSGVAVHQALEMSGELVSEVITVRWACASDEQRNNLYMMLKALKMSIINYIMGNGENFGVADVSTEFTGDGEDTAGDDTTIFTGGMTVYILYEDKTITKETDRRREVALGTLTPTAEE